MMNWLAPSYGDCLAVSAIYKRFTESKDNLSDLEVGLFRRHYKKDAFTAVPNGILLSKQRTFVHVALK